MKIRIWKWRGFKLTCYSPQTLREQIVMTLGRLLEITWGRIFPIGLTIAIILTNNLWLLVPLFINFFVDIRVEHPTASKAWWSE